jgi:hypothetical protein
MPITLYLWELSAGVVAGSYWGKNSARVIGNVPSREILRIFNQALGGAKRGMTQNYEPGDIKHKHREGSQLLI